MDFRSVRYFMIGAVGLSLLSGCADGFNPFSRDAAADTSVATQKSVRLVDRDVEAPSVFQASDDALWDGRPSLGGVWVASPDAVDPERVIMRNPANGKFVIGALFKRERDNPGPSLQISSDAAAAIWPGTPGGWPTCRANWRSSSSWTARRCKRFLWRACCMKSARWVLPTNCSKRRWPA